jgi:hypothetical protein
VGFLLLVRNLVGGEVEAIVSCADTVKANLIVLQNQIFFEK